MQILSLSAVKNRFSELVDSVQRTHDEIVVTRHGSPAVTLIATEELEALRETIFWLAQPGIHEDLAVARAEVVAGLTLSEAEVRAKHGVLQP
jgi:prevent-host-death family protein